MRKFKGLFCFVTGEEQDAGLKEEWSGLTVTTSTP